MSFNEWRHHHTNYDNRMRGAIGPMAQQTVQKEIAMAAMRLAAEQKNREFAGQVMSWAQAKRII